MTSIYSALSDLDYYGDIEPPCPSRYCDCPDCTQLRREEDLRAELEAEGEVALQDVEAA
jgi:hypothetical protein